MEAEVGRFRRIDLVPVPQAPSLADVNEVLTRMDGADDQRRITGKAQTVGEDFAQEAGSVCRGVLLLVEHAGAPPPLHIACSLVAGWIGGAGARYTAAGEREVTLAWRTPSQCCLPS